MIFIEQVDLNIVNKKSTAKTDEIKMHVRGRYICSMEAMWRAYGFETYPPTNPTVVVAKVYVEEYVTGIQHLNKVTDLIIYFNRPIQLHQLTYSEFIRRYLYKRNQPPVRASEVYEIRLPYITSPIFIYARQNSDKVIPRIEMVPITVGELWYLRLILLKRPAVSYKDCKTVNRITYLSYQEAAIASGYISDNDDISLQCFRDAMNTATPDELRNLFVTLTLAGFPTICLLKDDMTKHKMTEDYMTDPFNNLLIDISRRLEEEGCSMTQYGLPEPENHTTELEREKAKYNQNEQRILYEALMSSTRLNHDQKDIFEYVISAILENRHEIIFLQGDAGSGKTTLANIIIAKVRSLGKIVIGCASTGLAANMYDGFRTAHSLFKFPVVEDDDMDPQQPVQCLLHSAKNRERLELIENANLIVWDEWPSNHRQVFEAAYNATDHFKNNVVLCVGDFKQIAPVVPNGDKLDAINASVISSYTWQCLKPMGLNENMRMQHLNASLDVELSDTEREFIQNQKNYLKMTLAIGQGIETDNGTALIYNSDESTGRLDYLLSNIHYKFNASINNPHAAIEFVYNSTLSVDDYTGRAILAATNKQVDEWNSYVQALNSHSEHVLLSYDNLCEVDDKKDVLKRMLSPDVLHNLNRNGIPPHKLILKVGDVCLITRNLVQLDGLSNNTRVIIRDISKHSIRVQTISSPKTNYYIPRIRFYFRLPYQSSFLIMRTQFPLRLAYAMTFNKCQGQTLDFALVDLTEPPFSHGHLYVVFTRIKDARHIAVYTKEDCINADGTIKVPNVVYKELLPEVSHVS